MGCRLSFTIHNSSSSSSSLRPSWYHTIRYARREREWDTTPSSFSSAPHFNYLAFLLFMDLGFLISFSCFVQQKWRAQRKICLRFCTQMFKITTPMAIIIFFNLKTLVGTCCSFHFHFCSLMREKILISLLPLLLDWFEWMNCKGIISRMESVKFPKEMTHTHHRRQPLSSINQNITTHDKEEKPKPCVSVVNKLDLSRYVHDSIQFRLRSFTFSISNSNSNIERKIIAIQVLGPIWNLWLP